MKDAQSLKWNLKSFGLSSTAIDAAWPEWWSDAADASTSAQTELRFSISRKLGLDPRALLNDEPKFVWGDQAKFKRLTTQTEFERAAIVSFGLSVARALLAATPEVDVPKTESAATFRSAILKHRPFVGLSDLLALCWGLGIPVIQLRLFPLRAKRFVAMVVRANQRHAILIGKNSAYPSLTAFYLAHEFGHAALGHINDHVAVVECGELLMRRNEADDEEAAADRFALELLTGMPSPRFEAVGEGYNAPAIANAATQNAQALRIEAGTIALCFGYSTRAWRQTIAALKLIYQTPRPVWRDINEVAARQLVWSALGDDASTFLDVVMGGGFFDELRIRQ